MKGPPAMPGALSYVREIIHVREVAVGYFMSAK